MKLPKNFGGNSLQQMMAQAQQAMARAKNLEAELKEEIIDIDKGPVKASFDGTGELLSISIDKEVLDPEDVEALEVPNEDKIAYITQTTLSVDDCQQIIDLLKDRFPHIDGPPQADICYATSNRQDAVRAMAPEADLVLVVGDRESANSTRLAEIAAEYGIPSYLIGNAGMIDDAWLDGVETLLLTSGASAPDALVQEVIDYLGELTTCEVAERELAEENVHFRLPSAFA